MLSHILWTYLPFRDKEWCNKALVFAILPDIGYMLIMLYALFGIAPINDMAIPDSLMVIYHLLHSFVTLGIVAIIVWKFKRDLLYALSGWFLHILIDIPSHQGYYSTRFLYPLFPNVHIEGISWSNIEVLALSYSLLVLAYLISYWMERRQIH